MMAGLLAGKIKLLKRTMRGANPPLAADGKTQTAEIPVKSSRRRTSRPVDTILNEKLGGDR